MPTSYLVGAHEMVERLSLSHPQSVHTIRGMHTEFPQPLPTLKTALIWDWQQIERWAISTGRGIQ